MKRLVALLWLLLPAVVHAQAPQCTAAAPSSIACQSVGLTPQLSDILLGQQGTGPLRPNQTVQWPMSALFAPTAPAVAALLAAPPAIGGTTAAPGNFSSLSVNGVPVSPPGGATTQVQFNCAGLFCGDSTFTFNNSTKQLAVAGPANGTGALAVGTAGAASLLLSGAATTPSIAAVGTNASLAIQATGSGSVNIGNPGGGTHPIVEFFGQASGLADTLTIAGQTSSANPIRLSTTNNFGIDIFNTPFQVQRTFTATGAITQFANKALTTNVIAEGITTSTAVQVNGIENHLTDIGLSGGSTPYTCVYCGSAYAFISTVEANSIWHGFTTNIFTNQQAAPGQYAAWAPSTAYNGTAPTFATPNIVKANNIYYVLVTPGAVTSSTVGIGPGCTLVANPATTNDCWDGGSVNVGLEWSGQDYLANQTYLGTLSVSAGNSFNAGGTIGAPIGVAFTFNPVCQLFGGATWQSGVACVEVDANTATGSSVDRVDGVEIFRQGTVQARFHDIAMTISSNNAAKWLNAISVGNGIDPNGFFLRIGGSSTETASSEGSIPYSMANVFDLNDVAPAAVCNTGVVTPVTFTGSIAIDGTMTTSGSPSLTNGQYLYNPTGGASSPQGGTTITGGSGNAWTTVPIGQIVNSTTLLAGGAYASGYLSCPAVGGQGHRYLTTRAGLGVVGNGDLYIQTGLLQGSATGLTIDTANYKMTAATLTANSDGTGWSNGDLAEDPCGDEGTVAQTGGAVTSVTITEAGYGEVGSTGECPRTSGTIYWRPKNSGAAISTYPTGAAEPQTPFSVTVSGQYTWAQGTTLNLGNTVATAINIGNSAAGGAGGSTTTVGGLFDISSNTTYSTTYNRGVNTNVRANGTVTSGTMPMQSFYSNDFVNYTGASVPSGFSFQHDIEAGAVGPRVGLSVLENVAGAVSGGGITGYGAFVASEAILASAGGTSGTHAGAFNAGFFKANLTTAAGANWLGGQIVEMDMLAATGTTLDYKVGLNIVEQGTDAVQGTLTDAAIQLGADLGAVGWTNGIQFGARQGVWPFTTASSLLTTQATSLGGRSYVAAYGIDFSAVTFGTAFLKSTGFLVDGSGNTTVAALTATGLSSGTVVAGSYLGLNSSNQVVLGSGGGGAVSSVTNSDGTLTISPTTGSVVASLALGHANTWSGQQTFVAPVLGAATATSIDATATTLTIGGVAKLASLGTGSGVPLHLASAQTTAPALTSCGTGSPAIVGSDTAGTITLGTSASGCIATFNVAYTSAPHCSVTWRGTPLASQSYAVSTAAITLTQTSTSSDVVDYVCVAPAGG